MWVIDIKLNRLLLYLILLIDPYFDPSNPYWEVAIICITSFVGIPSLMEGYNGPMRLMYSTSICTYKFWSVAHNFIPKLLFVQPCMHLAHSWGVWTSMSFAMVYQYPVHFTAPHYWSIVCNNCVIYWSIFVKWYSYLLRKTCLRNDEKLIV